MSDKLTPYFSIPYPARKYIGKLCLIGKVDVTKVDFGDALWLDKGSWTTLEKAQYITWLARELEKDKQVKKGDGQKAAIKFVKHTGWPIKTTPITWIRKGKHTSGWKMQEVIRKFKKNRKK